MIHKFEDARHIGRKNCAKFARMHEQVPEFGLGYKIKKAIENHYIKRRDNQAYNNLWTSIEIVGIICFLIVVMTVLGFYMSDEIMERIK